MAKELWPTNPLRLLLRKSYGQGRVFGAIVVATVVLVLLFMRQTGIAPAVSVDDTGRYHQIRRYAGLPPASGDAKCPVQVDDAYQILEPTKHAFSLQCPPVDQSKFVDYDQASRYAERGMEQCGAEGMWSANAKDSLSPEEARERLQAHKCVAVTVGKKAGLQRGDTVFDLGSGCGEKAYWFRRAFGAQTFGIDMAPGGVSWSNLYLPGGQHCVADMTQLAWVPSNAFDLVFSFATVYHVPKDTQCAVMKEMVRIAKPGATVFQGWNGYFYSHHGNKDKLEHAYYPPSFWTNECFAGSPHHVEVVAEHEYISDTHGLFKGTFPHEGQPSITGSFAVLITKANAASDTS